ncbi:hypothetical protein Poli38472_008561 [Pythium oligandrum]|uniref:Protein kinase domain-containing protein n=1 Tax=Pythium oligandrum TaxID=41045 RepID=A0A8K1C3Z1_PYTOL|nr:hypothetical protein Poli38472_008561 [Pythium oligandrum]|eukprot:TMW55913.1 hypothetical protein Poli38472_008561 [Pythium oligandrum]
MGSTVPSTRGPIASLVLTLVFHVVSLFFGLLLVSLLVLTAAGLGFTLVCLFAGGNTRTPRLFVAWLWRMEMRINALCGPSSKPSEQTQEQPQYEPVATSASASASASVSRPPLSSTASTRGNHRGREVTNSVMTFSIMYFLWFKSFFNVSYAAVPLSLWFVTFVHVVPSVAIDLGITTLADDTWSQLFIGVAFAFFAHQIGLTSATFALYVSNKIAELIFRSPSRASNRPDATRAPLLPTDSFSHATYAEYQAMHQDSVMMRHMMEEPLYAEDQRRMSASRIPDVPSVARPQPPGPSMPPMPPMPPILHESSGRNTPQGLEHLFRVDTESREVEMCCLKVVIQRDSDQNAREGHRGGGWGHHGRGRGGHYHGSFRRDRDREFPHVEPEPAFAVQVRARSASSSSSSSSSSDSNGGRRRKSHRRDSSSGFKRRTSRRRLTRHNSFGEVPDVDLKQAAHKNMYEVLDLRPSAPPFSAEPWRRVPYARRSSDYSQTTRPSHLYPTVEGPPPYSQPLSKGFSDDRSVARGNAYSQAPFTPRSPCAELEFVETKRRLKEQAKELKEEARRVKHDAKEQAKQLKRQADRMEEDAKRQEKDQAKQKKIHTDRLKEQMKRQPMSQGWASQAAARARGRGPAAQFRRSGDKEYETKLRPSTSAEGLEWPGRDRDVDVLEMERHAIEIERAAQDNIERQERERQERERQLLEQLAASRMQEPAIPVAPVPIPRRRSSSRDERPPSRRLHLVSHDSEIRQETIPDAVGSDSSLFPGYSGPRTFAITTPYQAGALDQISHDYDTFPPSLTEADYTGIGGFGGYSTSISPATITHLDTGPLYRGGDQHDYNPFSPVGSSVSMGPSSFLEGPQYDLPSPTNSLQDADFPSEEFQQVYRSIRYTGDETAINPHTSSAALLPNYSEVPGRRDKVHFCSFAPPSVFPSRKSFPFSVWAFFLAQQQEMRERATQYDSASRQLSVNAKLMVRRGALVHVTLEVPTGFKVLNGATQGFAWEGKISNAVFDVECTDDADFGQVLFKASIVVGSEVAVLRSYVRVSNKPLDSSEMEAEMLESNLEVLDKTFQEVPYTSLELKELVGSGYFGDAWRATYGGQDVVVKTIRASEFGETNDQILREFQHEAAVLSMFGHHPCVVPFVGASTDIRFPLSLITQYLPHGSLEDNLKQADVQQNLSIQQRTLMLKDAAAGLLNIHEGGFIHRDIAARNCLVDQDLRVKICDFGLCRRVNAYGGSLMKDSVGPVKYMAPESLQPPHSFSFDSDSWMFGVLMWETYSASPPFASMTPVEAMMKVLNGERLPVPNNVPAELQSLMESCFHDTPSQRPSMEEILAALDAVSSLHRPTPSSSVVAKAADALTMATMTSTASLERRRDRSILV